MCIEPNPENWHSLSHRACRVVAAVVGLGEGQPVWFDASPADPATASIVNPAGIDMGVPDSIHNRFPSVANSTLAQNTSQGEGQGEGSGLRLTMVPLARVLRDFQAPPVIDYLSLDVEGAEYMILNGFPLCSPRRMDERTAEGSQRDGAGVGCAGGEFMVHVLSVERPSLCTRTLLR